MAKASYSKPTSQLDLEERQSKDYVVPGQINLGTDPQPSDSGFVGVDPVYQNFANDTEKPFKAEKGPEAKAEEVLYADDVDFDKGAAEQGRSSDEDDVEDKEPVTPTGSTGSTTTTPSGSSGSGSTPPPSGGSTPPSSQS